MIYETWTISCNEETSTSDCPTIEGDYNSIQQDAKRAGWYLSGLVELCPYHAPKGIVEPPTQEERFQEVLRAKRGPSEEDS